MWYLVLDGSAQQVASIDKKYQSRVYRMRHRFNDLVRQAISHWNDAPKQWKKPVELPIEGLFRLEADHPIHQEFGELGHNGPLPKWQSDEHFYGKVNAWHIVRGTEQELRVLQREKSALQFYATEELDALQHALNESSKHFS